jgi:hypothetical protein
MKIKDLAGRVEEIILPPKVFTLMLSPLVATTTTASSVCSAAQETITDGRDR